MTEKDDDIQRQPTCTKRKAIRINIVVNVCRLLLSLTLIFSGFVKAIDPLGTQYKIHDYLSALSPVSYTHLTLPTICSV